MNKNAVSLEAVHTHTHIMFTKHKNWWTFWRESYNLEDRISIFTYALLNIHARDG